MYQIVALLFIVTNGVPSPESGGSMKSKLQFETQAACESYLSSEDGTKLKAIVTNTDTIKNHQAEVIFECAKMGDPL